MILAITVAAILIGLILGWCVTATIATAAMSRSQERMQRKVRRSQAEAARAKARVRQLIQDTADEFIRSGR